MLRCPQCPERDSCKPFPQPTGPKPARVCVIGESPGESEIKQGRVFVGKTGQELDGQYLPLAGLQREDVYVTNSSKCQGRTKQGGLTNPTNAQARACWQYFSQFELRDVQPDVIVAMGAIAVDAVIGSSVDAAIDMEMQHGLPLFPQPHRAYELRAGHLLYVPVYHPAAGLHDTKWMIALQDDFRRLRKLTRGDYSDLVIDAYPDPQYIDAAAPADIDAYFERFRRETLYGYAGVDTEYTSDGVWCVTASIAAGTGIFVRADEPRLLARLFQRLAAYCIAFHSALADLPQLATVGFMPRRWVDTNQMAYWAQEFRLGLKPLAYRYLGMQMTDYADVVMPPSKLQLYAYMQQAAGSMRDAVPETRKPKAMTDEEKYVRKAGTLVRRLLGDLEKDFAGEYAADKPLKPWTRVDEWQPDARDVIEMFALGGVRIPRPSIAHVDRRTAVTYACRDADATLRLLPILRRKLREIRRQAA